ncbi:hypothetical protein [uncultured Chryseobacterium sp.]|uniref:hypothetical protein n=1 Tax=uncultured Chryseobacterium sp. TaxID=259322 RepID=UPI00258CC807|nr:hypothetical protein [uncultured Chryseobacterium sp.]
MNRKGIIYFCLPIALAGLILFLFLYTPNNKSKFILADIKIAITGKIKKKVAVRDNLLTHALIERSNKVDTLIFLGENIDSVNVNDNIIKPKNSPFLYVIRSNESNKKLKYVSIPKSILNDEKFPKDWKDSLNNNWKSLIK